MMRIDIEDRAQRAMDLFHDGYNCCQSVVLAFSDIIEEQLSIDKDKLASLTSGFGGGFGRLREVCGCVSGMTFMAGLIKPSSPNDQESKTNNYTLVQKFAAAYKEENGSIVCRDLLDIRSGKIDPPNPSLRTAEYYKARPCSKLVACAASIVAQELQKSQ